MQKLCSINNLLFVLFFSVAVSRAQQLNDWDLVQKHEFTKEAFQNKRIVTYLFADKNIFIKYNPVSLTFGGLLFLYQKVISTQVGAACPYEISCSAFSNKCIRKYGLFKGIPLTADRLTRCTRLALIDMVDGVDYSSRKQKLFDSPDDYSRRAK